MKGALNTLSQELNPHKAILEAEPKYRKNLAQSLLYKTILSIIYETLDEKMKSAVKNVLNRDVSSGQQIYKTDQELWPMNKGTYNIPNIELLLRFYKHISFTILIDYLHKYISYLYLIIGVPKLEGKVQCTGEAQYTDDFPKQPGELVAAMVQAKQARCELDTVDTSAALVRKTFYHLFLLSDI